MPSVPVYPVPTGTAPSTPASGEPGNPSSPSTPGPSGPTAPEPTGPTTGGPAKPGTGPTTGGGGPTAPGLRGPTTGGRGMAMSFERGATSKNRLKLEWKHPVPPAGKAGTTVTASALPLDDALKLLWETDERPLLVLRECAMCQHGDEALLTRSLNNDRTLLLAKWFRLVRLPPHVLDKTHAFNQVFTGYSFKGSPHFFLLAHPDAQPVEFSGVQTQSMLWKGMQSVLAERYSGDAVKAVKDWLGLLERFDRLDAQLLSLQQQLDEARANEGPQSGQAKSLQKRIADARKDHMELLAREERIRNLGLRPMPTPAKADVAAAAGGAK